MKQWQPSNPAYRPWPPVTGHPPPQGSASSGGDEAEAEATWEPDLLPCPWCDRGNPWPLGVAGRGKTVQGTMR